MPYKNNTVPRICEFCDTPFLTNPTKVKQGKARFCSRGCASRSGHILRTIPTEERFWSKVAKPTDPEGCWLWTGGHTPWGYGCFQINGKQRGAHVVGYEFTHGAVPAGLCVCHRCDTPACVRPDHLFLGTHAQNMADKVAKNRQARGETHSSNTHPEARPRGTKNGSAKLTDIAVLMIRQRYDRGGITLTELGAQFGVGRTTIRMIVLRKRWTHLP